jgi:hypothetical protein
MYLVIGSTVSAQEPKRSKAPEPEGLKVFSKVEGRVAVLSILPEGTPVKKGDVVCELAISGLRDRLARQKIIVMESENRRRVTKLDREVAEIAVTEYIEGGYRQEKETVQGEIALAAYELKQAEDRLERSQPLSSKGEPSKSVSITDKMRWEQKKFALEQAQTKLNVLDRYTKEKTIKKLKGEVEKAVANETLQRAILDHEKAIEERLTRQIENCTFHAPGNGRVHLPRPIEAGTMVAERQLLLVVIPEEAPKDGAKPSP